MLAKELNQIGGIYQINNITNGKSYIGSAKNILARAKRHFYGLEAGIHHNMHLQSAYDKHGLSSFEIKILVICEDKDLIFFEQRFMDAINPEYNICRSARNGFGRKKSDEEKARLSKLVRAQWASDPERRKRQTESNRKIKHSAETRALISKKSKEMWANPESRKKLMDNQFRPSLHKKLTC